MLVVEVNLNDGFAALSHLNITHIDVLNDAAPAGVRLDTEHAVEVGRVHDTVVGIDVLAAAADFGTYHHAAVAVVHGTVADDDILRRHIAFTSVAVASAFNGDTVVAGVEETVLNQYAVATLRVAAVAVGTVVNHLHTTDGNVGRVQGVNHPER